jgi:hypothetical protein
MFYDPNVGARDRSSQSAFISPTFLGTPSDVAIETMGVLA